MISGTRRVLARAFRRAALPLGWYYAVTLALPFANGAAQSSAFVEHALVVLVVPPVVIMLGCALNTVVPALAGVRSRPSARCSFARSKGL